MNYEEIIEKRFTDLLKEGNDILLRYRYSPIGSNKWRHHPSEQEYNKFFVSAKNLIETICINSKSYVNQMDNIHQQNEGNTYYFDAIFGILQAAYDDWNAGLMSNFKNLVVAELFSDFEDQSQYFLEEGYKMPAAVIIGSVLEDALFKLCLANGISLPKYPKIDLMNSELAKKNIYGKNVQKQITAWAGIRNSAAHGKINEFSEEDVRTMIQGVINFNATFLK